MEMQNFEKIRRTKEKVENSLLKKGNVVGVGIGRKITKGKITDELSMRIYVEKKKAKSQLSSRDLISGEVEGVKTDIIEVGKIRFQQCNQKTRKRPAFGGDSVGSCHSTTYGYIMAGTLGCVVIDNTDGERCILSNNHVLADVDTDTTSRASVGDPLVQPGTLDGGTCATTADRIATLKRWIPFTSGNNLVDAAIGEIITDSDVSYQIGCDLGTIAGIRELTEDDVDVLQVQKCGRTTCYTTGTVMDIDVTALVGYERGGTEETYRFVHQIFLTDMSDGGDSGSIILDMEMNAVGLLFAGSDTVTVASPIQTVFNELNVELPPPPDLHCRLGGPDRPLCIIGGPGDVPRLCRVGGPQWGWLCRVGGPSNWPCVTGGGPEIWPCVIGGPGVPGIKCSQGGPFQPQCLACGPDSPIGCGMGGPDTLVDVFKCFTGPKLDINFVNPVEDPSKILIIDMNRIPKGMQRSLTLMLKEMGKER
jgi:hypothetical protein